MRQGGISSRGFYPETQSSVFFYLYITITTCW